MEEFLSKLIDALANPQAALIVGIVLEFALRLSKTEKPQSIIRAVASVLRMVGKAMVSIADFTDKVLPQRTKE
jgi:hypothetical protein